MKNFKIFAFSITFSFVVVLNSCDKKTTNLPEELVKNYQTESGEITFKNINKISFDNPVGGFVIRGINISDTLNYRAVKLVSTTTKTVVQKYFDNIKVNSTVSSDSLIVSVNVPYNEATLIYGCELDVEVPYLLPCSVNKSSQSCYVYYLAADLQIKNAHGKIEVQRHDGSCNVSTSKGDIIIEIAPPANGYCHAFTKEGDIELKIPKDISASIDLVTSSGEISFEQLDIKELVQTTGLLTGKLGGGNVEINIITNKGDIKLTGF